MTEELAETAIGRPAGPLRVCVGSYTGYRYAGMAPGTHPGMPSMSLTFIVAFDEPLDLVAYPAQPTRSGQFWALVGGLHDAPATIRHDGRQHGIQLDITPVGCRALFGLPAGALAHEIVRLDQLIGKRGTELVDRLAVANGWAERYAVLDDVLLQLLRDDTTIRPDLSHAWDVIGATDGRVAIGELAADIGWSRRHLLNQFSIEFGLSPKTMAQVARFDRASKVLRSIPRGRGLADVAARCGYSDQAHLTRDWCRFTGTPPSVWREDPLLFSSVQDIDRPEAGRSIA